MSDKTFSDLTGTTHCLGVHWTLGDRTIPSHTRCGRSVKGMRQVALDSVDANNQCRICWTAESGAGGISWILKAHAPGISSWGEIGWCSCEWSRSPGHVGDDWRDYAEHLAIVANDVMVEALERMREQAAEAAWGAREMAREDVVSRPTLGWHDERLPESFRERTRVEVDAISAAVKAALGLYDTTEKPTVTRAAESLRIGWAGSTLHPLPSERSESRRWHNIGRRIGFLRSRPAARETTATPKEDGR